MRDRYPSVWNQLLSVWLSPRTAAVSLYQESSFFVRFSLEIILLVFYFAQLVLFLWIADLLPDSAKLYSWKGVQGMLWFLLFLGAAICVMLNLGSLVLYFLAKGFGGQGNLKQTKMMVSWASTVTIPMGFLFLLFFWCGKVDIRAQEQGLSTPIAFFLIQCAAIILCLCLLVYGVIVFVNMISEAHKISPLQALVSILASLATPAILLILFML